MDYFYAGNISWFLQNLLFSAKYNLQEISQ